MRALAWTTLALSALACSTLSLPSKRATTCNGYAELCSRSYGNVTFFGSHNSYAFSQDTLVLSRNQEVDVPTQLRLGVRLLQAQSHRGFDGTIHFCHTSCFLFDGGRVVDYLSKVKTFLDGNPNEVVTLIFTNPENLSIKDIWKPAFDASGITPLTYVPPTLPMKRSDWPTLGELIDSGKRVVVFLDAGADTSQANFILPEFKMIWESPFGVTDPSFPCKVDRIDGPLPTDDHMYMINHSLNVDPFKDGIIIPDRSNAERTNGVASILAHSSGCAKFGGNRHPNFVLLDWVNVGEGLKAVDELNRLS